MALMDSTFQQFMQLQSSTNNELQKTIQKTQAKNAQAINKMRGTVNEMKGSIQKMNTTISAIDKGNFPTQPHPNPTICKPP